MNARIAAGVSGAFLLAAAICAWWVHPAISAVLVSVSVIVMSVWQIYRRRRGIAPMPPSIVTTYVVPLTFGALAVIALNGWNYRIASHAGSDGGEFQMLIGLLTGVVGMSAAYGYGRLRAQKAQVDEVVEVTIADDRRTRGDVDDEQWFFPQAK
ncbi:hypothetical protein [Gordonia phthalatica]|uniref:Uncharacterized protein n=1 Tax=Gordonia phthalatica TaxID=1136941 RepID=A0A0N9NAK8_9ACTN|nr:hypothetical protein [Gordonia phthalatica]ALG84558.1 hypothetical protein ACH46_08690 [Gordonia phthalatica]